MRYKYTVVFLLICASTFSQTSDSLILRRIYDVYLTQGSCYSNLAYLTSRIGGRLSGSAQAAQAVEWAKKAMYAAGADTVMLQPCLVPHWVRGKKEKCILMSGQSQTGLKAVALGSSVGTGSNGINAEIIEIKNFDELEQLGEKNIRGKVVFYNVFFNQAHVRPGQAYGETVGYRSRGASQAAKYGAVAILVRSMTSLADDEPHTGNMNYDTAVSKLKIPAFALSYVAADQLSEALKQNKLTKIYLESHCETLPPVQSYNVVGQLNGSQKPNEFILAGGHLDSWDLAQGAQDDGAGVVQCIDLLAAFKKLGIRPKHSIRVVAFMNEENGLAGGRVYAKLAEEKREVHLAALETDAGGYTPRAFGVDTTKGLFDLVVTWKKLFTPYLIDQIKKDGEGADISVIKRAGVPCMAFEPDQQRYFDIHHTAQDTFDKVNKRELELGAAAIGALIYLIDLYY